jgi:hypothetical protein
MISQWSWILLIQNLHELAWNFKFFLLSWSGNANFSLSTVALLTLIDIPVADSENLHSQYRRHVLAICIANHHRCFFAQTVLLRVHHMVWLPPPGHMFKDSLAGRLLADLINTPK